VALSSFKTNWVGEPCALLAAIPTLTVPLTVAPRAGLVIYERACTTLRALRGAVHSRRPSRVRLFSVARGILEFVPLPVAYGGREGWHYDCHAKFCFDHRAGPLE
jgi:hypothetical protein